MLVECKDSQKFNDELELPSSLALGTVPYHNFDLLPEPKSNPELKNSKI